MLKHLVMAAISLTMTGYAAAANTPAGEAAAPAPDAATMRADALKLCERLAGTEREICARQARENALRMDPGSVGATPGTPGSASGGVVPVPPSDSGARTR
jgi:hypothetical protein